MKTKSMNRAFSAVIGLSALLWTSAAYAGHPATVTGSWNAIGNQTLGVLRIVQAVSAATCKPIGGSIFVPNSAIRGFYCPATGRIVFARHNSNGVAFQLYEGHVSRDGAIDRIGGSLIIWNAIGGGFDNEGVDFNFSATK